MLTSAPDTPPPMPPWTTETAATAVRRLAMTKPVVQVVALEYQADSLAEPGTAPPMWSANPRSPWRRLVGQRRPDRPGGDRSPPHTPPTMTSPGHFEFREIDVVFHAEEAVRFRADSFECSFGSPERFYEEAGPECRRYLDGLSAKNRDLPGSCVHVWLKSQIVGQVEVRRDPNDAHRAHVLLYYIIHEFRGRGLGKHLDTYVESLLRHAGVVSAWLRVSPTNARAMRFYQKHAWIDRGPDEQHPDVHVMEKNLLVPSPTRGGS